MTIFDFTSYNLYLAAELEQRKVENPLYSLRSMATHIGVSAATLSQVIKGQKNYLKKRLVKFLIKH